MQAVTSKAAAVMQARQLFFEEGQLPSGLVHDAVWRSWQRCTQHGRHAAEAMVFNQVRPSALDELLERNRQLIVAAEPAIQRLAQTMNGTGYGILLTDSAGLCVAAHGPIASCGRPMRQALRPGVDLSEQAIGTNAMWTAMAEGQPIGIFGAEHFFAQNQAFQCVAAPIFGPDGRLAGAIDISRDLPGPHYGALAMMLDCAAAIERALLLQTPAHCTISLHWSADVGEQQDSAVLAFGADGQVLALNRSARRLFGHGLILNGLHYRDLFGGDHAGLAQLPAAPHSAPLLLQSGLRVFARVLARSGRASVPARLAPRPLPTAPDLLVEFGDPGVHQAFHKAMRALNAGLPVMIRGETGTGKEVAARALHSGSAAASGPFVAINCGAIPRELIEGELFGYADGAFTGARRGGAKGRIEEANGGTLFLDEIGDMPLDLQTRLLRVLESREVTRLGESTPRKLTIQLLSATHQDLDGLVRAQRFRSDLYFRLAGMDLMLPPLRERSQLGALIDAILKEEGIDAERLAVATRATLEHYAWPGNTRELRTVLRFARAIADDDGAILCHHLPDSVRRVAAGPPAPAASGMPARALKDMEDEVIGGVLAAANGNITVAAGQLGISRSTLHRWLKRH